MAGQEQDFLLNLNKSFFFNFRFDWAGLEGGFI
jgi:hypothetical protein